MNRFHLHGNQNDLIEKLSLIFINGKPVTNYPKSFKGINYRPHMKMILLILEQVMLEDMREIFESENEITAILLQLQNYFNPVIEIHFKDKATVYITVGDLFTVGSKVC